MPEFDYGDYRFPFANTWDIPASNDCQRITPEPQDGSTPAYVQDDNMLEGRTMGQFIILPDASYLMINGAAQGTAGYTTKTPEIPITSDLPFGLSLATKETLKPALYFPDKPKGQRWSDVGLGSSTIARMYHSGALVLRESCTPVSSQRWL